MNREEIKDLTIKALFSIAMIIVILFVLRECGNNIKNGIAGKRDFERQMELLEEEIKISNLIIEGLEKERDSLVIECKYLDSTSVYWKNQYNESKKKLQTVKSKHNEKIKIIDSSNSDELNHKLTDEIYYNYFGRGK